MSFIKRTSKNKKTARSKGNLPCREEVIDKYQEKKNVHLPPLREKITITTKRNNKYEPYVINFEGILEIYPDFSELLHEFQVGIEMWAEHKSSISLSSMPKDLYLSGFLEFTRLCRDKKEISHFSDITPNVMRNFKVFLKVSNNKYPMDAGYRYIKTYIKTLQRSKYKTLSNIGVWQGNFPSNFPRKHKPKKGLSDSVVNQVDHVTKKVFIIGKDLYKKRKKILKKPIFLSDFRKWSLANTLWFYHYEYLTGNITKYRLLQTIERNGYSLSEIESKYKEKWPEISSKAKNPREIKAVISQPEDIRFSIAISELRFNYPEYPFDMDIKSAAHFLTDPGYASETSNKYVEKGMYLEHPSERLWQCVRYLKSPFPGAGFGGVHAVNSYFHPTIKLLGACFVIIQKESGWNRQTLLDFEFGESFESSFIRDLCCENHRIMIAPKNRAGEEAFHRTYIKNKYGAYQVLRFLWEFGREIRERANSRSPWLYLSNYFLKTDGPIMLLNERNLTNATRALCNGANITDDSGQKLSNFGSDQLRQNFADDLDELSGGDSVTIARGLQNNLETTEKHYRNRNKNKKRLEKELGEWVTHFTYFQGAFHPKARVDRQTLSESESSLSQVITTDGVRPVLVCGNPYDPDWVNCDESVGKGDCCSYFNGCATCSNAVIFSETLPFIFARLRDLERSMGKLNRLEWENAFYCEHAGWNEVVENWPSIEEVNSARKESERIVLPISPILQY